MKTDYLNKFLNFINNKKRPTGLLQVKHTDKVLQSSFVKKVLYIALQFEIFNFRRT